MKTCEVDLRVGGTYRYVMTAHGGFEVAFQGEYHEIVPDERIVATDVFEGMPEVDAVSTMTLEETNGRTILRLLVQHTSRANRDAHLASGMENGMQVALDRLEQVAGSLS